MIKHTSLFIATVIIVYLLLHVGESIQYINGNKFVSLFAFMVIAYFAFRSKIINHEWVFKALLLGLLFFFFELVFTHLIDYKKICGINAKKAIYQDLKLRQRTYADELGINKLINNDNNNFNGYRINQEGFRSDYTFTKTAIDSLRSNSKIIMFIGDSHTEGCCASPIQNSFVDLIDQTQSITALNFGIGGMDPLQYVLIAKQYIPKLLPDAVFVTLCLGNDFMYYDRKPAPYKALQYQTNYSSLSATLPLSHPEYEPNKFFSNWNEAKTYYLDNLTIEGEHTHILERVFILPSNFASFLYYIPNVIRNSIYFFLSVQKYKNELHYSLKNDITYRHLATIRELCKKNNIEFKLLGVPTIRDMQSNQDLVFEKYQTALKDIPLYYPKNFVSSDFVSRQNDHFNNVGHKKYAAFIDVLCIASK